MAETTWPGERLIAAAQGGDPGSLSELVSGSHPNVQRFARSLCASPEDAQDAAQEALIILYRRIGTLRASGALASWMFRIVRNECLRRARGSLARGRVTGVGAGAGPEVGAGGPPHDSGRSHLAVDSAEEEALRGLEAERVAAAVAALPPDQRRVLVMRDIEGRAGREVAAALGLSTAAMKSRLHRARATLRESLAGTGDGR
ncbi:RNA polymerase sigma factor [Streptomyces sp. NPDC097619]|uniref:RNA polymerase sigma factor n=1 Tax=Streptomyces sp. NPDC097619 TaxID=3157228 RepID=UPI003330F193